MSDESKALETQAKDIFGDVEEVKIPTPEEMDGKVKDVVTVDTMDDSVSKPIENPDNIIKVLNDDGKAGNYIKVDEDNNPPEPAPPAPNPFILTIKKEREFLYEALGGLLKMDVSANTKGAGRYKGMVYSNLEAGRNWLGKLLGELGAQHPYVKMADTSSLEVDPATDTTDGIMDMDEEPIVAAKHLRNLLAISIDEVQNYRSSFTSTSLGMVILNNIFTYLNNAKMYLGWMIVKLVEENE